MAQIVIAEEAGACYGVERALELVLSASESVEGPLHTLGPLIHNPLVVHDLERRGVTVVEDAQEVEPGSTLVLRTHGVTPKIKEDALAAGAKVIDATCPFVMRAHRAAERLERDGYQVLIVGEAGHPEVEGTLGHAPSAIVVGSPEEAASIELCKKVGIVVQTTQSKENLLNVISALVGRTEELRLIDTICEATSGHQGACERLSRKADVMVVIGGRNSANTTHLAEIAQKNCQRTHHIERDDELDPLWFSDAELIGITAGASTPATQIESVRQRIQTMLES